MRKLEWACRAAAIRGALQVGLGMTRSLFINVEPEFLGAPPPAHLEELVREASQELRIVLEYTERGLRDDPAALVQTMRSARERFWGVAMDDIGVDPASLSLLPLLRPDVLKLDMGVTQGTLPIAVRGRVLHTAITTADRTGAAILAEGIETDEQATWARNLGVRLGQGWHFGRPGALDRPSGLLRSAVR